MSNVKVAKVLIGKTILSITGFNYEDIAFKVRDRYGETAAILSID